MSEQQVQMTTTATDEQPSGPDDSEPSPERQAELRKVYEGNVAVGKPPYAGADIGTCGELNWIRRERGWILGDGTAAVDLREADLSGDLRAINLYRAKLSRTTVHDANFSGAYLVDINLVDAFIFSTDFSGANLNHAILTGARIHEADFSKADLTLSDLSNMVATGTDFGGAQLDGSNLRGSRIVGHVEQKPDVTELTLVNLIDANLYGADLSGARITGAFIRANMFDTNLSGTTIFGDFTGADLTQATMDAATKLGGYTEVSDARFDVTTRLLDVAWNGVILSNINWDEVPRLGDEVYIKDAKTRKERVKAYRDVARAYYGLANALESQGLTIPALRYRRRQHQLQRKALIWEFKVIPWLFSSALNIISGYGDRPLRALGVYLAVVLAFAGVYFGITTPGSPIFFSGSQPLDVHEAIVFSISSFHGRGFFPTTISLGDPVATVAAFEAIVGLFIELVLIATFTRRLFER